MFKLLLLLAVAYVILKVMNTRAEFARRDAEREAQEKAEAEALEEIAEEDEIRHNAIDVDAEVFDTDEEGSETIFEVEPETVPADENMWAWTDEDEAAGSRVQQV